MKIKEILKGVIYGNDYIMPLRKELLLLLISGLSFIGFSSAGIVSLSPIDNQGDGDYDWRQLYIAQNGTKTWSNPTNGLFCLQPDMNCQNCGTLTAGGQSVQTAGWSYFYCTTDSTITYQSNYAGDLRYYYMLFSRPAIKELFPDYTSQQCQEEYDLVPNGSTDVYVVIDGNLDNTYSIDYGDPIYLGLLNGVEYTFDSSDNNFNFTYSCPVNTGSTGGLSTLYINDIWHESKPFIYVNIPEEFNWDYTGTIESFIIDVEGYNTDTDYIEGVINIQNSKPSKEDLNNIITGLIPLFVPGLVIILFIYFVFKLIKKIF